MDCRHDSARRRVEDRLCEETRGSVRRQHCMGKNSRVRWRFDKGRGHTQRSKDSIVVECGDGLIGDIAHQRAEEHEVEIRVCRCGERLEVGWNVGNGRNGVLERDIVESVFRNRDSKIAPRAYVNKRCTEQGREIWTVKIPRRASIREANLLCVRTAIETTTREGLRGDALWANH